MLYRYYKSRVDIDPKILKLQVGAAGFGSLSWSKSSGKCIKKLPEYCTAANAKGRFSAKHVRTSPKKWTLRGVAHLPSSR